MKKLILFLFILISTTAFSQFAIGTRTITFNDPLRSGGFGSGGGPGRQIQCEIYYPATTAGSNVAVANGSFPVVVFGHGFAMAWSAYENIWTEMVPKGYVFVFPRTEGGLIPGPSHGDFGLDLAIVEQHMVAQGNLSTSPFYQKLNNNNAIMGHSMGGGATILAGENNTSIKTIIGLAPAETTPSAITAAANVTVPALILSGGQDGVTPPSSHHTPIYNALSSDCKTFVNIIGGAHCYFANSNFNCDFGESTSSSGISISRAQQHQKMFDLITPWLAFYLKEDCDAFTTFENQLNSSGITSQRTCNYALPIVDNLQDQSACGQYILPAVSNGIYYTQSGGQGSSINIGHQITSSQSIYLYSQNGFCTAESQAQITIDTPVAVDLLNDVVECGQYILPTLNTGSYYTSPHGTGQMLPFNEVINSSQTVYIYAENGTCHDESQFTITITSAPSVDVLEDVVQCENYALPQLNAGNYYTESGGNGMNLSENDVINTSQIVFIYANNGTCSNESSFEITINTVNNSITQSGNELTAVQNNATYQWVDCTSGNTPIAGATNQTYAPSATGSYAVVITQNECESLSNCLEVIGLSVASIQHSTIRAYPNPTQQNVRLDVGSLQAVNIVIRDMAGKEVYNMFHSTPAQLDIQLKDSKGIYLIEVWNDDFREIIKLVKQ
jgi:predicted dienelactone hydrolase